MMKMMVVGVHGFWRFWTWNGRKGGCFVLLWSGLRTKTISTRCFVLLSVGSVRFMYISLYGWVTYVVSGLVELSKYV